MEAPALKSIEQILPLIDDWKNKKRTREPLGVGITNHEPKSPFMAVWKQAASTECCCTRPFRSFGWGSGQ
jgi:hypothetical protein